MKTLKNYLPIILGLLLIVAMMAWSELAGEREIIFPEMAAIVTGAMVAPKFAWNTSKLRLFLFIMIAAVLGMLIVAYVPMNIWLQLSLAFLIGQLLLLVSQTGFAPMISAIVLPVMLQTEHVIYLISAAIMTLAVIILIVVLERIGLREKREFIPKEIEFSSASIFFILKKCLVASILLGLAVFLKLPFMMAPPLLVAFTEFCQPQSKVAKVPVQIIVTVSLCAFAGALSRLILSEWLMLPLFISSLIAMILVIIIFNTYQRYLPPAAAIAILAFLIRKDALLIYPFAIIFGISLLVLSAKYFFKHE